MKKLTGIILALALVFSFTPVLNANAFETLYLRGDVNLDGKINVEDARCVMRASIGIDPQPKAGTPQFERMKFTSSLVNEITMEDARTVLRAAIGLGDYTSCYTKQQLVTFFNTLANRVKQNEFRGSTRMTSVASQTTSAKLVSYDFGELTDVISDLLGDGFSDLDYPPTTIYPISYTGKIIFDFNYPLEDKNTVSELTAADVSKITIQRNVSPDVLSSFPDRVNSTDVSKYKNVTGASLIKIHIEINSEKYSFVKTQPASYRTNLSKIYDLNMKEEASHYWMEDVSSDEIFTYLLTADLDELTTSGSVDYYFTSDTFLPVCARYNVSQTAEVDVNFTITAGEETITGKMKQTCLTDDSSVYIFEKYYPTAGK